MSGVVPVYEMYRELRIYVLETKHLEKLGAAVGRRKTNLFSILKALAARKILHKIEFKVVQAASGAKYGVDALSEGEKQLLCVIGGLTLSHQQECLVLLDEPDNQ